MIKKIFSTVVCTALFTGATANLTITNNSNINQIQVKCSGPLPGVPIAKHQTISLGWMIIRSILGGSSGTCAFYNANQLQATASLVIASDYTHATIVDFLALNPNLHVVFTPDVHTAAAEITATVTGG